jgi:hypothetical protein
MRLHFTTREMATLAMLVACNAAMELTLGNLLHAVRSPMTGSLLVGLNLVVYAMGYLRVPRPGAILVIGVGTAFLKFALAGSFKMLALPAIVLEAALIDLLISRGGLNRVTLVLSGILASVFSLGWRLTTAWFFVGIEPAVTLARLVHEDFAARAPFLALLGVMLASRALAGALFGLLAWRVLALVESALHSGAEP